MKKVIATVLVALIAFAAFASISFTLDTITSYSSSKVFDPQDEIKSGFRMTGAEPDDNAHGGDVIGEFTAAMGKDSVASAFVTVRFRTPKTKYEGADVKIHGWEITARIASGLKVSVGNTAYEVFAETISWEPVSGAGLFEQGANRIYIDYIPSFLDSLEIIAGMSMGDDARKPWKTAQVAAILDFVDVKFAFEFHNVCSEMGSGIDGDTKAFSAQVDYVGKEGLDLLAGYSLVRQGGYTVQHRFDFLGSIYGEKFGLELYDAFIIRRYEGEKNGNRLGAKVTFYASETLYPYVKMNWFKNYGYAQSVGGFAWGDWQLSRKYGSGGATVDNNNGNLLCLDAGIGFTLSTSLSGSIGGVFKFNLTEGTDPEQKLFWSIPLCLTATF